MLHKQHTLRYVLAMLSIATIVCCGGFLLRGASTRNAPASSGSAVRSTVTVKLSTPDGTVPAEIHATVRRGPIAVTLTVAPVDVGSAQFSARVAAAGKSVTDDQVRLRLSMPSQPTFGVSSLDLTRCAAGYCGRGQLQALGRWHVEVQVCGFEAANVCAGIPFDFMNGANARFLFAQPPNTHFGPASVRLTRTAQGGSSLQVRLRSGLSVRAVMSMPNMLSMGSATVSARSQGQGRYLLALAFPMTGVMQVTVQVRMPNGWQSVRTLLYDADSAGNATLITNTPS